MCRDGLALEVGQMLNDFFAGLSRRIGPNQVKDDLLFAVEVRLNEGEPPEWLCFCLLCAAAGKHFRFPAEQDFLMYDNPHQITADYSGLILKARRCDVVQTSPHLTSLCAPFLDGACAGLAFASEEDLAAVIFTSVLPQWPHSVSFMQLMHVPYKQPGALDLACLRTCGLHSPEPFFTITRGVPCVVAAAAMPALLGLEVRVDDFVSDLLADSNDVATLVRQDVDALAPAASSEERDIYMDLARELGLLPGMDAPIEDDEPYHEEGVAADDEGEVEEYVAELEEVGDEDSSRHLPAYGIKELSDGDSYPRDYHCLDSGVHIGKAYMMWGTTIKVVCKRHTRCSMMVLQSWFGGNDAAMATAYQWMGKATTSSEDRHYAESRQIVQQAKQRYREAQAAEVARLSGLSLQ